MQTRAVELVGVHALGEGKVVAVVTATVAASATIAVALEFPAAANYLDHGANLTGTSAYLWDLNAGGSEGAFVIVWVCVPIVDLVDLEWSRCRDPAYGYHAG